MDSIPRKLFFCIVFFMSCFSMLAHAQANRALAEEIPPTRLSVFIVGDSYTAGGKINTKNKLPDFLRAIGRMPGEEEDRDLARISLRHNRIIPLLDYPLPPNVAMPVKIEADYGDGNWRAWTEYNFPPGPVGRDITLLFTKKLMKNNRPPLVVLDNSLQAVPNGAVRVINASSQAIYCNINEREVVLRPGNLGVLNQQNAQNEKIRCQFSFAEPQTGEKKLFVQRSFRLDNESRTQIIFFDDETNTPGRIAPIKFFIFRLPDVDRPTIAERRAARENEGPIQLP